MAGTSWTPGAYVVAVIAAIAGSRLAGRWIDSRKFSEGAWDLILTKLIWTEGIARSPWLQTSFGQAEGQVTMDENGQTWIYQGGAWQSMQGLRLRP